MSAHGIQSTCIYTLQCCSECPASSIGRSYAGLVVPNAYHTHTRGWSGAYVERTQ